MHIHIVAVAGSGMGSLAGLLRQLGHVVSGSDVSFDPPMGPALEGWGVITKRGFSPDNLEPRPDLVVVGNVCRKDNVEVVAARERGLEMTHIAGALKRFIFADTSVLVVAGTHGKTTTTALAAYLLERAGARPGFLIGGVPKDLSQSFQKPAPAAELGLVSRARSGRKPPFVIEGDEYDTAYFEKTAKFLHYCADVAIITSIEYDHVDIYRSFQDYVAAFVEFIQKLPESGLIVANAADAKVVELVQRHARAPVSYYALEGDDYHGVAPHWLAAIAESGVTGTSFDVFAGGVPCGRFAIPLSGRHNVANAMAALAACAQGYAVDLEPLARSLATFGGVKRRQELLGTPGGVYVYDDFAHHPTAVSKTLAAFRSRHRNARLIALFEPRSATACRNLHQAEYVEAFAAADAILLAPLGRSGLPAAERLDTEKLAHDLNVRDKRARAHADIDSMVDWVVQFAEPGDVVAVLSNGAFGQIHQKLLSGLEVRFSG